MYQVDSSNTVTDEKRLNGFLEGNRVELGRNNWMGVGYGPGWINTSGGLTKSMPSVGLGILLNGDISQIVTESQ